jgi:hypothetical protein
VQCESVDVDNVGLLEFGTNDRSAGLSDCPSKSGRRAPKLHANQRETQFLVRADKKTKAGRGSAGEHAHFRAARLLGSQWRAGTENKGEGQNNLALKHRTNSEVYPGPI